MIPVYTAVVSTYILLLFVVLEYSTPCRVSAAAVLCVLVLSSIPYYSGRKSAPFGLLPSNLGPRGGSLSTLYQHQEEGQTHKHSNTATQLVAALIFPFFLLSFPPTPQKTKKISGVFVCCVCGLLPSAFCFRPVCFVNPGWSVYLLYYNILVDGTTTQRTRIFLYSCEVRRARHFCDHGLF